jgi:uncharacterized phiE125 gp8 family phage protein
MPLVLTSGPAAEPVTVAEAKAHLRVDGSAEDALIASLILTSRLHIETAMGLALITQGWRLELDAWPPARAVEVPIRPLQTVGEIRVLDRDGAATVVPAASYLVVTSSTPPRIVPVDTGWPAPGRPAAAIEIDVTAGFGSAPGDVPAPIRQALLLLLAHWYEHRDWIEIGSPETRIPAAVSDLLLPYRSIRL